MISIVIPTVGRPSLAPLLDALAAQQAGGTGRPATTGAGPATGPQLPDLEILLVDDRAGTGPALTVPGRLTGYAKVLTGTGGGPAAARNIGWRAARHPWVAFLDDDVVPEPGWLRRLVTDLDVPGQVGGVQGRIIVPLPTQRRPTDWERVTAGLADGRWITADMAYRRAALAAVGGFDERFPRAFREDTDIAYRVRRAGWQLVRGDRAVRHPVRPESRWVSLRTQRGNADDALLRRRYGPNWRADLAVPAGRRRRHLAVTAAGALALAAGALALAAGALSPAAGRRRALPAGVAALAATGWVAGTAEFAWARIAPGPRTRAEVTTMLLTSALIPPLAVGHWCAGWWRSRGSARAEGHD